MSTQPTKFRIIGKFDSTMSSLAVEKDGDTFSVKKLTGEDKIESLSESKLVPILQRSAEQGQAVLFISETNSDTITPTKPQTTLTIKQRVGKALAAIPADQRPEVRLIIESGKMNAIIQGQSKKFGTEAVKLQHIDLSERRIQNQNDAINPEFAALGTHTIPVITTNITGITFHPDSEPFNSQHPLGIVLNNFDKLFKIAA